MAKEYKVYRRVCLHGKGSESVAKEDLTPEEWAYFVHEVNRKGYAEDKARYEAKGYDVEVIDPEGAMVPMEPVGRFRQ